ncbi:hypothetical protein Tco_0662327 [Tanacetum coccineum]
MEEVVTTRVLVDLWWWCGCGDVARMVVMMTMWWRWCSVVVLMTMMMASFGDGGDGWCWWICDGVAWDGVVMKVVMMVGCDDGRDEVVAVVGVAVVEGHDGEGVAVTRWYWWGDDGEAGDDEVKVMMAETIGVVWCDRWRRR